MQKIVSIIMLALLIIGMLSLAFNIPPAEANGTIYIKADGSIDPSTAPIKKVGNTYTLTSDIYGSIVVEKDDIVFDGSGYTVQGTDEKGYHIGIKVSNCSSIAIKNFKIKGFDIGVFLYKSSNCIILRNNITDNGDGIHLLYSDNSIISENNVTDNYAHGMMVEISRNHRILRNKVANNTNRRGLQGDFGIGICFYLTNDSSVFENYMADNGVGIELRGFNNSVYRNNIVYNSAGIEICFEQSIKNNVYENNIANNGKGVHVVWGSSDNHIYHNNIANNGVGVCIYDASHNNIHRNNFINNTASAPKVSEWNLIPWVEVPPKPPGFNAWDDSKEGNYWSDFVKKYPYAKEIDDSGIWDTPYIISENNQDSYPLVNPVNITTFPDAVPPTVSIISPENKTYTVNNVSLTFTVSELVSWIGYSLDGQANVTITGNTTLVGLSNGSHTLVVYARDFAGNTGASEKIYFTIVIMEAVSESTPQITSFPTAEVMIAIGVIAISIAIILGVVIYKRKGKTNASPPLFKIQREI
ncbi:MAG: NosD domain-containing protein [Candidatus Bathyarchaeales archaeon]